MTKRQKPAYIHSLQDRPRSPVSRAIRISAEHSPMSTLTAAAAATIDWKSSSSIHDFVAWWVRPGLSTYRRILLTLCFVLICISNHAPVCTSLGISGKKIKWIHWERFGRHIGTLICLSQRPRFLHSMTSFILPQWFQCRTDNCCLLDVKRKWTWHVSTFHCKRNWNASSVVTPLSICRNAFRSRRRRDYAIAALISPRCNSRLVTSPLAVRLHGVAAKAISNAKFTRNA